MLVYVYIATDASSYITSYRLSRVDGASQARYRIVFSSRRLQTDVACYYLTLPYMLPHHFLLRRTKKH